jgi:hypothetical protein
MGALVVEHEMLTTPPVWSAGRPHQQQGLVVFGRSPVLVFRGRSEIYGPHRRSDPVVQKRRVPPKSANGPANPGPLKYYYNRSSPGGNHVGFVSPGCGRKAAENLWFSLDRDGGSDNFQV